MPESPEPLAGDLVAASEILGELFDTRGIRYAVLGGVATILRGRPRFTQDIGILVDVPQMALPGLLDELAARGFNLDRDAVIREFVQLHMAAFRFGVVRIDWLKPGRHRVVQRGRLDPLHRRTPRPRRALGGGGERTPAALAGNSVRLKVELKVADLYAIIFE